MMKENLFPINETVKTLTLEMTFEPLSLLKWSLFLQMEESFSMQKQFFGAEEGESEEFKRVLLDNHPLLLGLTMIISFTSFYI